jgi:hypothetical protein
VANGCYYSNLYWRLDDPLLIRTKAWFIRNIVCLRHLYWWSYKLSTPHLIVYSVHIIASSTRFLGRLPQDPKTYHSSRFPLLDPCNNQLSETRKRSSKRVLSIPKSLMLPNRILQFLWHDLDRFSLVFSFMPSTREIYGDFRNGTLCQLVDVWRMSLVLRTW